MEVSANLSLSPGVLHKDARITVRAGQIINVSWPGVLQIICYARKEADDAVYFTIPGVVEPALSPGVALVLAQRGQALTCR